jgi:hypothetical protein
MGLESEPAAGETTLREELWILKDTLEKICEDTQSLLLCLQGDGGSSEHCWKVYNACQKGAEQYPKVIARIVEIATRIGSSVWSPAHLP